MRFRQITAFPWPRLIEYLISMTKHRSLQLFSLLAGFVASIATIHSPVVFAQDATASISTIDFARQVQPILARIPPPLSAKTATPHPASLLPPLASGYKCSSF